MSWLLELLVDAIREMCSQFIVDMMELITNTVSLKPHTEDPCAGLYLTGKLVICLFLLVLQLVLAVFHAGSRE